MTRRRFALLVAVVPCAVALLAAPAHVVAAPATKPAAAPATGPATRPTTLPVAKPGTPPADVLNLKGLSRGPAGYSLASEKQVAEQFRALQAAKKKLDDETKQRTAIESRIKNAKGIISSMELERRKLLDKLAEVKDATQNNRLVAQIQSIDSKKNEGVAFIGAEEGKLRALGDETRTNYINAVLDLQSKVDQLQAEYALLASDSQTTSAATALKAKVGPSPALTGQLAVLKRYRSQISSDSIPVKMEGLVPHVDVTINGVTRSMVFDSGASLICIPAELAKTLELIPGADAPTLRLTLADGKQVEGKMMTLKTVRVGTFTVENVECAILPADLVAAQPLLGGSFLRNFIYRLDPEGRVLKLSKVATGDAKDTKPEAGKKK